MRIGIGLALALLPLVSYGQPPDVLIDVGHALMNPGATSARGVPEYNFNIALARLVYRTLDDYSRVGMVGADGDLPSIRRRGEVIAAEPAGFLISIHHDSVQPHNLEEWVWEGKRGRRTSDRFKGFSLFVSRQNPHLARSLACASAIGTAMQQAGFSFTKHHADAVDGESREWADESNGVYYYDNLVVLKSAPVPAVLFEAGVIPNPEEEATLASPEVRRRIARSIQQGLAVCGAIPAEPRAKFVWSEYL